MMAIGCKDIASTDEDFDSVPGIIRVVPLTSQMKVPRSPKFSIFNR